MRNFASALVREDRIRRQQCVGAGGGSESLRRAAMTIEQAHAKCRRQRRIGASVLTAAVCVRGTSADCAAAERQRLRLRAAPAWRWASTAGVAASALRCMSTLPRKCAPSAIATRGETMSPSTDPLSRMSTLSLAVTLPVTSPSTMTAFANTCALISPVRTDRQHVVAQLDRAFDMAFDGQIFAAVQLALDDDRFADVHDVLLHADDSPPDEDRGSRHAAQVRARCGAFGCPLAGRTASSRFHM